MFLLTLGFTVVLSYPDVDFACWLKIMSEKLLASGCLLIHVFQVVVYILVFFAGQLSLNGLKIEGRPWKNNFR